MVFLNSNAKDEHNKELKMTLPGPGLFFWVGSMLLKLSMESQLCQNTKTEVKTEITVSPRKLTLKVGIT